MCICTVVELINLFPVKVQAYKPLIPIQTQINQIVKKWVMGGGCLLLFEWEGGGYNYARGNDGVVCSNELELGVCE